MIGAILTTAALAFLASTLATIGNFAIARDFPHYQNDQEEIGLLFAIGHSLHAIQNHDEHILLSVIVPMGPSCRVGRL